MAKAKSKKDAKQKDEKQKDEKPKDEKPKAETRVEKLLASKLIEDIRKAHGKNIITRAVDCEIRAENRIPTNIFAFDYALGGGFLVGRSHTIWGHKSTGKTALCLRAIAQAQKMCAKCFQTKDRCKCSKFEGMASALLDNEGTWDENWAKTLGVDSDNLLLTTSEYAEQAFDIAEALIRSDMVDLLVFDSLAFMTPANEITKKTQDVLPAEQARVIGRGIRKFVAALNYAGNRKNRRPTVIFTNQVRMKLGVLFGSPDIQPGGNAPGFAATTETRTKSPKYKMDEKTSRPLYVDLAFKVEKNKSSVPFIEGEWRLMLSNTEHKKKGDVYDEPMLIELGSRFGLVEREGNKWRLFGEEFPKKADLETRLIMAPKVKNQLQQALVQILTD